MPKILCFILLFVFCEQLYSQVVVKGSVQDQNGNPIPTSTITFHIGDSLIAGIATQADGSFLQRLKPGFYVMTIQHVSYETYIDTLNLLNTDKEEVCKIYLKEKPYELDEAVITARHIEYESNAEKDVFYVPEKIKEMARDVYRVLQRVPMLKVDAIERTVTMLGIENSIIMVNNVQRDNAYLQTLLPEEIEKVEIIHSPGARYTSKNIQGIINIITKKKQNGHRGFLFGQLNPQLYFHSAGGGYSFLSSKMQLSVSGSYFLFNDKHKEGTMIREIQKGNDIYCTSKEGSDNTEHNVYANMSVNYDYILSTKSFFTLSWQGEYSPYESKEMYNGISFLNDKELFKFKNPNELSMTPFSNKVTGYYQSSFKEKEQLLSIEMNYATNNQDRDSQYKELQEETTVQNIQTQQNRENSLDIQADYTHPFSWITFETGYRLYNQSNYFQQNTNGIDDNLTYKEWRNFVYLQGKGTIKEKLSYQLGFGFDAVRTNINSNKEHFYEWIPNAMFRYKFNDRNNIRLTYNHTRNSPAFNLLNPIERYTDSLRITRGNPKLVPYYLNQITGGYTFYKDNIYISPSIRYGYTNDYITEIEHLDSEGIYQITYDNTASYNTLNFALDFSFQLTNWFELNGYGEISRHKYVDSGKYLNKSFWRKTFYINSSINYKNCYLNFSYATDFKQPTLTGFIKMYPESKLTFAWQPNDQIEVQLIARYLFPSKEEYGTYNTGYKEYWKYDYTDRHFMFLVGFSFSFQSGKTDNPQPERRYMQKFDRTIEKKEK